MNSWTVERLHRNVHRITFTVTTEGWNQSILLSGDRHHDNQHTNWELEKKHLNKATEINAPIIDVGDLFCAMQGRYDKRSSQEALRPEHRGDDYFGLLLEEAEEFYAPHANQFAVLGRGNHEASILKHNNLDLTKMLAKRLSERAEDGRCFTSGYGGYVILRFKIFTARRTYTIKHYHGSGGGGPVTKGVIQTNRRAVFLPDADIVVTGHIHEAWVMPIMRERFSARTGRTTIESQWHVNVPTYKEEYGDGDGGFHIERGRPPKPLGCAWIDMKVDKSANDIKMNLRLDLKD